MAMDNDSLITFLSDFVSVQRRDRMEQILSRRTRYVTVLLENIYQAQNASAVLRTCECFGVQDVHIIENSNKYQINPFVVKGSNQWLNIHKYNLTDNNSLMAVSRLKECGYRIVATSLSENCTRLADFDLQLGKAVIVFGNEHQGVSNEILAHADECLTIPMCGFTQSLNISVSAGIILSQIMQRLKDSNINWCLNDDEKTDLRLDWLKKSIKRVDLLIERYIENAVKGNK